jgi:hypothetical protein
MTGTDAIRAVLRDIAKGASTSVGTPPRPEDIYALPEHAAAIDPEVSLVVGNRGMGKTFWATALEQASTRNEIAKKFLGNRATVLRNVDVEFGFVDTEGVKGESADAISSLSHLGAEAIWRGLLLKVLSDKRVRLPFERAVAIAASDPERARAILRDADARLQAEGRRKLILFDQLDLLPGDWRNIQHLTKGLLRVTLAMKSYRNIRIKIFMRSDQESDDALFDFPDASKIRGEKASLGWHARNLYGLLFYTLWQNEDSRSQLQRFCRLARLFENTPHQEYGIPLSLAIDEQSQGAVFDWIAGTMMGAGSKRGRPYTWIPTHLADGRFEISPRSFLTAIKVAADHPPRASTHVVFDYFGIQAGVKEASKNRVIELKQDYPWIKDTLDPLHGMTVPTTRASVFKRWKDSNACARILERHKGAKAPVELVLAAEWSERMQATALVNALTHIGVFESRGPDRINIPDIFRIDAGIRRMGGITPQQRRRI